MRLKDMVAIVTGATRGLGLAMARAFVAEGAQVVLTGRSSEVGERLAREIGPAAAFIACDLADLDQVTAFVAQVDERFGRVDVLVNNAGEAYRANLLELPMAELDRILTINLRAPLLLTQLVGRIMVRERAGGSIINITSTQQVVSGPGAASYNISKAALGALTRITAVDLGRYGIRANTIGPGTFDTELMRAGTQATGVLEELKRTALLGRFGEVEELAAVAVFFASRESSYVTGQQLFVEGGRLALNPALRPEPPEEWVDFRR
jgi:glucose 1-dehydrogenase